MVGTPCVAVTMHLTTCQERRNITDAFLRAAVPMRSVTAGWQPAEQDQRWRTAANGDSTTQIRGRSDPSAFNNLYLKSSSRYSLVHIASLTF